MINIVTVLMVLFFSLASSAEVYEDSLKTQVSKKQKAAQFYWIAYDLKDEVISHDYKSFKEYFSVGREVIKQDIFYSGKMDYSKPQDILNQFELELGKALENIPNNVREFNFTLLSHGDNDYFTPGSFNGIHISAEDSKAHIKYEDMLSIINRQLLKYGKESLDYNFYLAPCANGVIVKLLENELLNKDFHLKFYTLDGKKGKGRMVNQFLDSFQIGSLILKEEKIKDKLSSSFPKTIELLENEDCSYILFSGHDDHAIWYSQVGLQNLTLPLSVYKILLESTHRIVRNKVLWNIGKTYKNDFEEILLEQLLKEKIDISDLMIVVYDQVQFKNKKTINLLLENIEKFSLENQVILLSRVHDSRATQKLMKLFQLHNYKDPNYKLNKVQYQIMVESVEYHDFHLNYLKTIKIPNQLEQNFYQTLNSHQKNN